MNKLINTLVCFFLLALNHLNGQLLLSASSDIQLLDNIGQTAKEIKSIPAHKNVQFIEYVALDSYNGNFKVKVYGQTGYINRNSVVYDDAFYMALRISEKQIYLKDASISEKIFSINKVKIREEQIWAKQNGFEHEEYKDMMAQLEKTLPVKPIDEITKNTTTISQQSSEIIPIKKGDDISNDNQSSSSKGGYCMKSLTSNYTSNVSSVLAPSMMNLINNEFVSLERFFNLDVTLKYSDDGPAYFPSSKTIITGNEYVNYSLKARQNSKYVNEVYKAVLAHEFAHALQDINGMFEYWSEGKQPELHADFLAGFYIGKNGLITKDKLISFADEFFDLGDTAYFDANHHGTPKERTCAFLEGYKVAVDYDFNIYQAYNAGVDYIKLLYPCDAFAIIREYSKTEYNNTNYKLPTGSYVFSSTEENMVFCNLYKQPLGEAMPGKDLVFNNLTPGSYIVIPAKKQKSGSLKYYAPYTFVVKPDHSGQLTIKQVGMFAIRTYSITF
jgi:hypothetical protein